MNKKLGLVLTICSILILFKFWIGVYADDEFGEHHIFIKHKPIWKTYFYSLRGMSDLQLIEMPKDKQQEQLLFDEFILDN